MIDIKRFLAVLLPKCLSIVIAGVMTTTVMAQKKPHSKKNVEPIVIGVELDKNDTRRFEYYFLEATRQHQLGNYDAAFGLLKHCLDINPYASEVYYTLSTYYTAMGNSQAALDCVRKAAEINPNNDTYLEQLGAAYLEAHDYEAAIRAFEKLADNAPGRTEVLSVLLQLYQWRPDYPKMIETLDKIETIEGSGEEITLSKMQVYAQQGDKKREFKELKSLAKQHPNDQNYRVMMGNWLLQNGKQKQALAEYSAVLKKEPDNIMAQMSMLDYYKSQKQDSLAMSQTVELLLNKNTEMKSKMLLMRQFISDNEAEGSDSTKVLNLFDKILQQPQSEPTMAELKAAYMSVKKMPQDTINKALERVLEIDPGNVGARLQLLQTAWDEKNFERVVGLAKPGTEYNPDEIVFYYFQGLAFVQQDKDDEALDTFRKGVGQTGEGSNKDLVSDFYAIMGDILHQKHLNDEAFAAYDSCLQWKPDNIGCLNNYAYYLSVQNKDLAKAEQMSYRTVKAEPNNATFLDTYAWILFMQQRYEEAKIYIDQALASDSLPGSVITEHAGDIYAKVGDIDKALEFWQKALELNKEEKAQNEKENALEQDEEENALLQEKIKLKKYIEDNTKH